MREGGGDAGGDVVPGLQLDLRRLVVRGGRRAAGEDDGLVRVRSAPPTRPPTFWTRARRAANGGGPPPRRSLPAPALKTSITSRSLRFLTASGTSSLSCGGRGSSLAASTANMNAFSYRTSSAARASPDGPPRSRRKAEMKSDEIATLGRPLAHRRRALCGGDRAGIEARARARDQVGLASSRGASTGGRTSSRTAPGWVRDGTASGWAGGRWARRAGGAGGRAAAAQQHTDLRGDVERLAEVGARRDRVEHLVRKVLRVRRGEPEAHLGWASASISRRPPKRRLAVGGGTIGLKPAARCASAYAALSAAPSVPPPLELSAYEFTFCPSSVTSR